MMKKKLFNIILREHDDEKCSENYIEPISTLL